jgi:hypothetical protein
MTRPWTDLPLQTRLDLLKTTPLEVLSKKHKPAATDSQAFLRQLEQELALWNAGAAGTPKTAGRPPTKDILLGAYRDLDRSEAIAELIDNSIDHWRQRVGKKADLKVEIRYDEKNGLLIYEDNAGGVREQHLDNLVIPGYSDTTPAAQTIGSYKTGGKKAVFRLASAARIDTWNEEDPAGLSILLDEAWMNNIEEYRYPYAPITDRSALTVGHTRYVLHLKEDRPGQRWPQSPDAVEKITKDLRKTYTLLLIRNPKMRIQFLSNVPLESLSDLYEFSGAHGAEIDLRPQQILFDVGAIEGTPTRVEVVLGFRRTSGSRGFLGIDLYGNDRLFVQDDQHLAADLLAKSSGPRRELIRGFINIHGANAAIPWDTHKRHLNLDAGVLHLVRRHPAIQELFDNWVRAANDASSQKVKELIDVPPPHAVDRQRNDLWVRTRDEVDLSQPAIGKRGLPDSVFAPKAKPPRTSRKPETIKVTMSLDKSDARAIAAYFGVALTDTKQLATEIKAHLLAIARRKSK